MKSYLLSSLAVQARARGREAFTAASPRHWLVWEPGSWKPPQRHTTQLAVRAPTGEVKLKEGSEALVIAVEALGRPLILGRAADCDLVINDGTLSGRHLGFAEQGGSWSVEDLGSTNGTTVDGVALRPGLRASLRDGARLAAGSVHLTFHSSEGLWPRLSGR